MLRQGVQGISDLITVPGLINLDFADVRTVMKDAGSALMGIGRASGEDRAATAAREAISSPLLELNINGAQGVLFNVTGGPSLALFEVDEAAEIIKSTADPEANIIFGTVIDERMGDEIAITVIATGFDASRRREVGAHARAGRLSWPASCARASASSVIDQRIAAAIPISSTSGNGDWPAGRGHGRAACVERRSAPRAAARGRGPRHPGVPAPALLTPTAHSKRRVESGPRAYRGRRARARDATRLRVTLLAVTKSVPIERLRAAVELGLTDLAENRVQEAEAKVADLPQAPGSWSATCNRTRRARRSSCSTASSRSIRSSLAPTHRAARRRRPAGRRTRSTCRSTSTATQPRPASRLTLEAALPAIAALPGLELRGLMTVGRLVAHPAGCAAHVRRAARTGRAAPCAARRAWAPGCRWA